MEFDNIHRYYVRTSTAANWIRVGQTTGRGKKSLVHHPVIPVKDIWLYPLRKNFGAVLCD
jgi:hypothetical protein